MYIFLIFFISLCSKVGSISVNITSTQFLKDPDEITSSNNNFKVGFFSPPNSTDRYVGIWYNTGSDALEVVWVANKDNPLKGSSGVLQLSEDGNLQVLDDHNKVFWSSNITNVSTSNSSIAQLQDSGNLVLLSNQGEGPVWQSFEDPINLLIPLMTIGSYDGTNNTQQVFRSWKSPSDPSSGRFTLGITPSRTLFEIFIWNDGQPYWRTGPWNGNLFIGLPATYTWGLTDAFEIVDDNTDQPSLRFLPRKHAILVQFGLTNEGLLQEKELNEHSHNREITWSSIESECDVYGRCGSFGRCNPRDSPICCCLEGFEPINNEEWSKGNWTRGCARKTSLQCDIMTSNADGFLKLQNVKVPDHAESLPVDGEEDCRRQCQAQCSCLAYAYNLGIGCITWNQTLIDIQAFNTTAVDLFIRLANSELADKNSKSRTIAVAVAITGTFTLAALAISLWKQMNKRRENRTKRKYILLRNSMPELMSEVEFKDLPLFKFENLEVATNNFHVSNKLGQGGFGPVFKGKLKDGQEVAVKRLSRASGQGLKQFMNEVLLISKLQHRNLVRLLGCCVEGEERLLVYEYMPNKSLDALIFDHLHREHLDWKTRFDIIKGICWGLLYLHRDSRLRIIHRDLKPSNILLDEDLNPKISDFGMAKIFGGVEDQGNTSRVVGTYGYMSPEYAMQGRVSEKLDVYSFGIMLLEIISGKRNGSFQDVDEALSISGHAWNLWKEDDVLSLIDPIIGDPCFQEEISKFIHIGLLCVQEFPEDRPTISTVISMLDSEILDLPCPMRPGFTNRRRPHHTMGTANGEPNCSMNNVSITILGGR